MPVLKVKRGGGDFHTVPQGTFRAVCIGCWDIGRQPYVFEGKTEHKKTLMIRWELDKRIKDPASEWNEKRYCINKRYAFNGKFMHEKSNLYKDLLSWLGVDGLEEFDTDKLVGKSCIINVIHKPGREGAVFANVASVSPLMDGMSPLEPELVYDSVPEWVQKIIEKGLDSSYGVDITGNDDIDDINQEINEISEKNVPF